MRLNTLSCKKIFIFYIFFFKYNWKTKNIVFNHWSGKLIAIVIGYINVVLSGRVDAQTNRCFDRATESQRLYFDGRNKPINALLIVDFVFWDRRTYNKKKTLFRKWATHAIMLILTTHLHCYEKWAHIYKERINTATAANAEEDCCDKKLNIQF